MLYGGYAQDYGYWWIEICGDQPDIVSEYEDIRDQLVSAIYGIWNHIKNEGEHGADNFELQWVGMLPGVRESRRIECDYMLNENDLMSNRRFEDKVAYGGWHIDNHRNLFAFDELPSVIYEVPGSYDIPYRSYCVKNFKNLFVGGRCMGASKMAMSSTRVMGTCAIGGQAIGTAAAQLCASSADDIRKIDIPKLQNQLIKDDCFLPLLKNNDEDDLARTATVTASSFLRGFEPTNIINGLTRCIDGNSNAWRSTKIEPGTPEWISLSLSKSVSVNKVNVVFDSNFNVEKKITLSSARQKQQSVGVPAELVKDFEIEFILGGKTAHKETVT